MIKTIILGLSVLLLSLAAFGQGTTTNLGMPLPPPGSLDYVQVNNGDLTIIDTVFGVGTCGDSTHALGYNSATKQLSCQTITGVGAGVTSVAQSFTGGLISVSGSPITTSGTLALTVAGTSGGIPYFSSSSSWASSAALTANLPVIGGGPGVAPTVGTVSGNTTKFATFSGAATASRCIDTDASGNLQIVAADCGTVASVAQSFTGGLISVAGSPITGSGTLALTVAGTSGGVPYFSSGSSWGSSAALGLNGIVMGGGAGSPPFTAAGLVTDGISVVTLGVAGSSVGGLVFKNATSGSITLNPSTGALGAAVLTLPAATDTLTGRATIDIFTNKTYDTAGAGNVFEINGTPISATTGSGAVVLVTSPTLVTPILGAASATSLTLTGAGTTAVLGTSAITNGTCASLVTVAVTGAATTSVIAWDFASSPLAVTGYGFGGLNINAYATAGNANFLVCNPTGGSITPAAMTLNFRVIF